MMSRNVETQSRLFDAGTASLPERVTVFASGANEVREILGFALAGVPVGFAVSNIRQKALDQLLRIEGPLFADSGAFTEISFASGEPVIAAPIAHKDWIVRLDIYRQLAEAHGSSLFVVAPDMVANQQETLRRLTAYRSQLQEIASLNAQILIPVQTGELSPIEFYHQAVAIAGLPLVPAFPMKKAASSHADILTFVRNLRPGRLHLLGMGYERATAKTLVRRILDLDTNIELTLDSNRLRAVLGNDRVMTIAEREMRNGEISSLNAEAESEALIGAGDRLDYTDAISSPSCWASELQLREIAVSAGFDEPTLENFVDDPDSFLQLAIAEGSCCYWELPAVESALDAAWYTYVQSRHTEAIRIAAIRKIFTDSLLSRPTTTGITKALAAA